MFERLSGILRRFLLTALFLLIVAGALGALFSVLVLHLPPLKIFDWLIRGREAPLFYRTELPKDERFRITLWEYDYPVPYGVSPYRSYLEEALDAFNELYPNIEVEVQFLRPGEGQAKLRRALAEGYPPDVYSTWWEEPPAVYPFQVPVTPYLLEGERGSYSETGWLASARGQKGKEILWAWPRWLFVRAMMANRNLLDTAEVKIEELADGWTLDDMATLADRIFDLEKTAFGGAAPVVLAVNPGGGSFHRELTLAAGVPSLLDPVNGELAWKPADAEALGLWLEGMSAKRSLSPQVGAARRSAAPRRFPDPQDTKGLPAPQTLTQFLAGRAVLLGGVNPALAHYLNQTGDRLFPARPPAASSTRKAGEVRKGGQSGGTAGANGTSPWVFLPLPGPPGKQGLPVIGLGALVVFYQADFKGQPHTQAAVELARHLSRWRTEVPLGLFAGVPAYQDSMRSWITGIIGEAGTGGSSTGGSSSAGSSSAGTGSGGTGTSGTEPSAPAAAVRGRQTEQFAQGDQLPIDLYESFRKWGGLPEIVFPQVRVGLTALPRPALDADGARWLISELERAGKSGFTVYPTSEAGDLEAAVWHDLVLPAINAFWSGGLDATQFAGQIAAAVDRRKDVANGDN